MTSIARTYNNRALVGNWYEDRLATPRTQVSEVQNEDAGKTLRQDKLVRDSEPNTFRTQTVDFSKTPSEPYTPADTMRTAKTTKAEMESRVSEVLTPQPKLMMVNCENLRETMQTDRPVPGPRKGFGSVMPRHASGYAEQYTTSSQHFYVDTVAKAKAEAAPGAFTRHAAKISAGTLYRGAHTLGRSPHAVSGGSSGARGEITRHPGNSGSVYGMSVWADEYCKWGTQLEGMKRRDTVTKRCTTYLNA